MRCKICNTLYAVTYNKKLEYDICATCLQVVKDNIQLYAEELLDKYEVKPINTVRENAYASLEEDDD